MVSAKFGTPRSGPTSRAGPDCLRFREAQHPRRRVQRYRELVDAIDSQRLHGRRVTNDDFEFVVEVWNDQRVSPTVGGPQSDSYLRCRLDAWSAHWDAYAFGVMVFTDKGTGERIGWGGLQFAIIGVGERLTVGYVVAPSAWECGYATEIASASVEYAFEVLAAPTVFASVLSTNAASRRVLEKANFSVFTEIDHEGSTEMVYESIR